MTKTGLRAKAIQLLHWAFYDKSGKLVLGQAPNLPLYVALVAWVVRHFSSGWLLRLSDGVFLIAIIYWAVLEITKGDSRFRRALGLGVLVLSVVPRVLA